MGSNPNFRYSAMAPAIEGWCPASFHGSRSARLLSRQRRPAFPEAKAPHFRRNIEALHLTTAVRLDGPKPNTTDRSAVGVAGKQQFASRGSILTGHGLHLCLE